MSSGTTSYAASTSVGGGLSFWDNGPGTTGIHIARTLGEPVVVSRPGLVRSLSRPAPVARLQTVGRVEATEPWSAVLPSDPIPTGGAAASTDGSQVLRNGSFDDGSEGWFRSHLAEDVTATVVEADTDPTLELITTRTEGSAAQDLTAPVVAGRRYDASVRAVSPSGLPVLIELAVHGLRADGSIGETSSRYVMVEELEVPVTAALTPTESHASLRVEVYVHTVDRAVRLDDAKLVVDGSHHSSTNYGYQQPRVRYLDGVNFGALTPGGRYRVEVTVGTTTDQPWFCCGSPGAIYLGTEDEDLIGGSGRASALHVPGAEDGSNWTGPNRIAFDRSESTIGGSFTTVITAPNNPGPFAERFRPVAEGVTWMPGPVIEIIGSVLEPASGPVIEAPGDSDDSTSDLLVDCPPKVSIANPDPTSSDCVGEIAGFAPRASDVGVGRFTLSWRRPAAVSVDFYIVEIQDLALPAGQEREAAAVVLETGERSLLIETEPGRYSLRVIALDENGQWVRSADVEVEVTTPSPIVEVDLPPIVCPAAPVTGSGFPIPCTPVPDGQPTGPVPQPNVPGCQSVSVTFEDDVLMRYRGSDRSSETAVDLSCTEYDIELVSSDPRHGDDYQPDQTGERWYLEGLNVDGDVIYTSQTTADLPEDETESTLLVGPVDLTGVVAFRAQHLGRGESANSVMVAARLLPVR